MLACFAAVKGVFTDCRNLESISFPTSIQNLTVQMQGSMVWNCSKLSRVHVRGNLEDCITAGYLSNTHWFWRSSSIPFPISFEKVFADYSEFTDYCQNNLSSGYSGYSFIYSVEKELGGVVDVNVLYNNMTPEIVAEIQGEQNFKVIYGSH